MTLPGKQVTGVAERIRGYQARYELDSIVIDANKQAVEEMSRRHELPAKGQAKLQAAVNDRQTRSKQVVP